MFGRRGKSFAPPVLGISVAFLCCYVYYMYHELNVKYEMSENKLGVFTKRQISLKSQLHVVYEHRSKLEAALVKQMQEHRATKQNFVLNMKECTANLTKSKQEALNRFNALDTEHHKLKGIHEEVSADFSRMQQQYVRLTEDHRKIINGHKEDYETLKELKEKESKSLRDRVDTLYSEKEVCSADVRKYNGFYHSERSDRLKMLNANDKLKRKFAAMEQDAELAKTREASFEDNLNSAQKRIEELENQIEKSKILEKEEEKVTPAPDVLVKSTRAAKEPEIDEVEKQNINKRDTNNNEEDDSDTLETTVIAPTRATVLNTTPKQPLKSFLGPGEKKGKKKTLILKPSDKVKKLLISRDYPTTVSSNKEDSIKDQYEVADTPERGGINMVPGIGVKPTVIVDYEKETNFQHLVKSELALDSTEGKKGDEGDKGVNGVEKEDVELEKRSDRTSVDVNEKKKGKGRRVFGILRHGRSSRNAHQAAVEESVKVSKKDKKTRLKMRESYDQTDEVSMDLKKLKNDEQENSLKIRDSKDKLAEGKLEIKAKRKKGVNKKKNDNGALFLQRQQKLLHRPVPKSEDEVIIGGQGEPSELSRHGVSNDEEKGEEKDENNLRNQLKPPDVKKNTPNAEIPAVAIPKKRRQLQPPNSEKEPAVDDESRNDHNKENNKQKEVEEYEQNNEEENYDENKDKEMKKVNQLHAPIGKPVISDFKKKKAEAEKEISETAKDQEQTDESKNVEIDKTQNGEDEDDENGDQDLDKHKIDLNGQEETQVENKNKPEETTDDTK